MLLVCHKIRISGTRTSFILSLATLQGGQNILSGPETPPSLLVLEICSVALIVQYRAVARSENLEWHVLLGGDNVPPGPPAPLLATGLYLDQVKINNANFQFKHDCQTHGHCLPKKCLCSWYVMCTYVLDFICIIQWEKILALTMLSLCSLSSM